MTNVKDRDEPNTDRHGAVYTNLEQTPLKKCQQLPASYKRLVRDENETDNRTSNRSTQVG